MKFVVCVIEGKQIYFRGRMEIELDALEEEVIQRQLNAFIEVGKEFICKHFKNKISTAQIIYKGEDFSFEDNLIFDYQVLGRPVRVLFKRVGPISYTLARFFKFI